MVLFSAWENRNYLLTRVWLSEVPSRTVGEEVMRELKDLDPVAYVRFASVYREFKDIDQFMDTIRALTQDTRVTST